MPERDRRLTLALSLIRQALALLDRSGESDPAIHLQRAIDAITDAPIPRTVEEADAMLAGPEALGLQRQFGWVASETLS